MIYFKSSKITNGKTNGTNGDVTGDGDKLNGRRKFSKRDEELIRLIGQHLLSVGLENSARTLVKESDTTFENTSASLFRQSILDGDWENAFAALNQLQYYARYRAACRAHAVAGRRFLTDFVFCCTWHRNMVSV